MDKIFIVLYNIWATIDSGRLPVGLSHPLVEAEAVPFSDPSKAPPGALYSHEEEPKPDQSVIVQLHPELCFY